MNHSLIAALGALLALAPHAPARAQAQSVTVFAAASLKTALDDVAAQWRTETGKTARISYAASSGGGVASAAAGTTQPGRDHWPRANSMLWAGGGITGGQVIGATDDFGYRATVDPHPINDLHATILHMLGLEHTRLTYFHNGRMHRLTDVAGEVIPQLS